MLKRCGVAGYIPADDVRIHPTAADLLADLVHDEQIDLVQWQLRHQRSSSLKKHLFLAHDNVGPENPEFGRLVMLIFKYGNRAEHANISENDVGKLADRSFVTDMSRSAVCIGTEIPTKLARSLTTSKAM